MTDKPTEIKLTNDETKRLPPAMKKIRGPPGARNKSPSEERKMSPEKVFSARQPMKMWASEAKTKPRRGPPGSKYSSPTRTTTDESHFSGFNKPAAFMTPQATKESNLISPLSLSEESKRSKPRINGKRAPPGSSNQFASSSVKDLDPNGRWALNFGKQLNKTGFLPSSLSLLDIITEEKQQKKTSTFKKDESVSDIEDEEMQIE